MAARLRRVKRDEAITLCDLSGHPEYARRVGEIMSLWALIELKLSLLFGMLLRSPPWTAWEAFFALSNARSRVNVIRSLAKSLDARLPEREELLALIKRVSDAPAVRNGYAHKPWVLRDGKLYQLDLPAIPIEASKMHHVSITRLNEDCAALRYLHQEVSEFDTRFSNKYLLQLEPQVTRTSDPWPGMAPEHTRRDIIRRID
jgi:hypothetical protein